jgi:hypothetical protein
MKKNMAIILIALSSAAHAVEYSETICRGETSYGPVQVTISPSQTADGTLVTAVKMDFQGKSASGLLSDDENSTFLTGTYINEQGEPKDVTYFGRLALQGLSVEIAGKASSDFGGKDLREYPIASTLKCQ